MAKLRVMSMRCSPSTLITSAPRSQRMRVQVAPPPPLPPPPAAPHPPARGGSAPRADAAAAQDDKLTHLRNPPLPQDAGVLRLVPQRRQHLHRLLPEHRRRPAA